MKLKRGLILGIACVAVMAAVAVAPRGESRFDWFDLIAAVPIVALGVFGCARLKRWDLVASVGYFAAIALLALDTGNRVAGYPDKELLWAADLLWLPLLGVLVYRRHLRVVGLVAAAVGCTWLGFGARQLAWLRDLDQPGSGLAITAVSKVVGGRVWAFGCSGDLQVVAVYTRPSPLADIHGLLDGRGSMDAQIPNVPLPFRWRVRCPTPRAPTTP